MRTRYFAPCPLGIEAAAEGELHGLGALEIETVPGGVHFRGGARVAYAANLWLRSAIRVQELIAEFPVGSKDELYDKVSTLDWSRYMSVDQTLAIDASVQDSALRHSKYAALVTKDAIVDQFRERCGRRPSVDRLHPDLPLKLVIKKRGASLWRNMSGTSLHKRGWRDVQHKAPLSEAIAAGLVLLSGWDLNSILVDPMCGSGTFVVEAAMLAARIAPGLGRRFAFEHWPDFEPSVFVELRAEAEAARRPSLPFLIEGSDVHGGSIELAKRGARRAGVEHLVRFSRMRAREFVPQSPPRCVITNPPYGKRLAQDTGDVVAAWRELGHFLHEQAQGATAWVLSGNRELTRHLGLKSSAQLKVKNGSLDCRFLRYELGPAAPPGKPVSAWVRRHAGRIPRTGPVLDVACGSGRHSALLLELGHEVVAVDRDTAQLAGLAKDPRLRVVEADLEAGPWPFEDSERFAGIVVTNYLWRPLLPRLAAALEPGGILIYETFAAGPARPGKPTNPDYLLRPGELLEACRALTVLAYEHGDCQRICAAREPCSTEPGSA